jgi:hypothetical protein
MPTKVNGKAMAGEFLGGNLDFYTVVCVTDITPAAVFDKVIEVISTNGQPVLLGAVTGSVGSQTFRFAIEHEAAWAAPGFASAELALKDALLKHAKVDATVTLGAL